MTPLIAKAAREALDECGGNRRDAVEKLMHQATLDNQLWRSLTKHLIQPEIERVIRELAPKTITVHKDKVVKVEADAPLPSTRGLELIGAFNLRCLMEQATPNGIPLGSCNREQVQVAAVALGNAARGSAVQARFYALVAKAMPARGDVREVLSEAKLGGLLGTAERDMERYLASIAPKLEGGRPELEAAS